MKSKEEGCRNLGIAILCQAIEVQQKEFLGLPVSASREQMAARVRYMRMVREGVILPTSPCVLREEDPKEGDGS